MLLYLILIVGAVGVILLLLKLASGPSPSKALKRRMELVKERHAEGVTAAAQAQIRKLMAARSSRFEGFASSIIPRPALLRKRLEMTGRSISLGKYGTISLGVAVVVIALLMFRGAPFFAEARRSSSATFLRSLSLATTWRKSGRLIPHRVSHSRKSSSTARPGFSEVEPSR